MQHFGEQNSAAATEVNWDLQAPCSYISLQLHFLQLKLTPLKNAGSYTQLYSSSWKLGAYWRAQLSQHVMAINTSVDGTTFPQQPCQ